MNVQLTNVVPIRPLVAPPRDTTPKVLNVELVGRLQAINRVVRWLRAHDLAPHAINALAVRPTVTVQHSAARLLIPIAHGASWTLAADGDYLGTVVVDGCAIQWKCTKDAIWTR